MKYNKCLLLIAALAPLALPPATLAQSGEPGPHPGRRGPLGPPHGDVSGPPQAPPQAGPRGGQLPPWLDINRDGFLDADELSGAIDRLAALDSDGDGYLSPAELAGPEPGAGRGPRRVHPGLPPAPPLFLVLDTNRDGLIDADELDQLLAVVMAMDADGDERVSAQEFHARGPRGPGAAGGRPEGRPGHQPAGPGPGFGQGDGPRGPRGPGTPRGGGPR